MRKVFIEGDWAGEYSWMFSNAGWKPVSDISDASLICFTGGEDVTPSLYGHPCHPTTSYSKRRDALCLELYKKAEELGIPRVGICRGGQFLNVVNGGTMVQDVKGHCQDHSLRIDTGNAIIDVERSSSTHHQMMMPGPKGAVIGTSLEYNGYDHRWWCGTGFTGFDFPVDNEVVLYKQGKSLCFQPHPEFPGYDELQEAFFKCLELITGPESD